MKDRTPRYPGRVIMRPVAGQANTYDMTRADSPIEVGTPLNKQTLLTDETAYLLELKKDNPTPDDAFAHIASNFAGNSGMGINLLEEAINMKYCKVLTLENTTAQSAFLSDAVWSLGCKSTTNGWSVVAKHTLEAPMQIQFQSTLSNGSIRNFSLDLGFNLFPQRSDAISHMFTGTDCLCTVQNRSNEVCLILNGYTSTTYPSGSSTTTQQTTCRIWCIFDVTTGTKKASTVYGTSGSYASYLTTLTRSSLWCYYNATYGYYYAPWYKSVSSASLGYLCALPQGNNYMGSSADSAVTAITSFYLGTTSTDYYSAADGFFVNDTTFLWCEVRPNNTLYLHKGTLTAHNNIIKAQLASTTSIPTFNSGGWGYASYGKLHMLKTASNQLYLYAIGQASTTTTQQFYVINRYGPFTISTTSITEASHYKRMAGYPSTLSYSYIYPIANLNGSPDRLVYCLSATLSSTEVQYFQVTGTADAYRAISPGISSNKVNGYYINGLAGRMRPICCVDNSFSWMFLGSHDRIASFQTPTNTLVGKTQYWTCPEDGRYKIILVGGGASGGKDYGGGSGHLKIVVKQYYEGDTVPFVIGMGQETFNPSYSWMYRTKDRSTYFDDEIALCGAGMNGGANGYSSEDGGGGGGYNLVTYGGNGQPLGLVPVLNGGQGTVSPASGYGAGGSVGMNGKDGVIVIIR